MSALPTVKSRVPTMCRPTIPREDQNKRSACDRCRRQKLRCERRVSATTTTACNRCLKSRSKCVTSPSLPMGRPRIKARSTSPPPSRYRRNDNRVPAAEDSSAIKVDPRCRAKAASVSYPLPPSPAVYLEPLNIPTFCNESDFQFLEAQVGPSFDFPIPPKEAGHAIFDDFHIFNDLGLLSPTYTPSKRSGHYTEGLGHLNPQVSYSKAQPDIANYGPVWPDELHTPAASPEMHSHHHSAVPYGSTTSVASLLNSSYEFLRMSEHALSWSPSQSRLSSRTSSIDRSSPAYGDEISALGMHRASTMPYLPTQTSYNSHVFSQGSFDTADSRLSASPLSSLGPSVGASYASVDAPNYLALILNYESLIRTYRGVLSRLNFALLSQPLTLAALGRVLPGLCPPHYDVEPFSQAKVFLQVCRDLLERMERSAVKVATAYKGSMLGGAVGQGHGQGHEMGWPLLDSVVREHTGEGLDGSSGSQSWRMIIGDITIILDSGLAV